MVIVIKQFDFEYSPYDPNNPFSCGRLIGLCFCYEEWLFWGDLPELLYRRKMK